jgi:hypothetical protein
MASGMSPADADLHGITGRPRSGGRGLGGSDPLVAARPLVVRRPPEDAGDPHPITWVIRDGIHRGFT